MATRLYKSGACSKALISPPRAAARSRLLWSLWVRGAWVRDEGVNGAGVERHVGVWVRDVRVFYGADDGRLTGSPEKKSNNTEGDVKATSPN